MPDKSRHVFFAANDKPEEKPYFSVKLRRTPLPRRLASIVEIFSAPAIAIAGDLMVTRSNAIRGAILATESRQPNAPLLLYPWLFQSDSATNSYGRWSTGSAHRVPWPHSTPPARSIVRINDHGQVCVLLAQTETSPWWHYSTDGRQFSVDARLNGPVNIVFRYGDDPSLMLSAPFNGYRFIKPGETAKT